MLDARVREAEVEALEQRHHFLQRQQAVLVLVGRLVRDCDPPARAHCRTNRPESTAEL